jgi:ankyrin repeat protein
MDVNDETDPNNNNENGRYYRSMLFSRLIVAMYGIQFRHGLGVEKEFEIIASALPKVSVDIHAHAQILRAAIEIGRIDLLQFLMDNGVDICANENNAMIHSARYGNQTVLNFLLTNGADIHAQNDMVLVAAAKSCNKEMVEYVVSLGVDPYGEKGFRALLDVITLSEHVQDISGCLDVIRLFVKRYGVNIARHGRVLLMSCPKIDKCLPILRYLVEGRFDTLQQPDHGGINVFEQGVTFILYALNEFAFETVRYLINVGVDFHADHEKIFLYAAVSLEERRPINNPKQLEDIDKLLQFLVEKGVDMTEPSVVDRVILTAFLKSDFKRLALLLAAGGFSAKSLQDILETKFSTRQARCAKFVDLLQFEIVQWLINGDDIWRVLRGENMRYSKQGRPVRFPKQENMETNRQMSADEEEEIELAELIAATPPPPSSSSSSSSFSDNKRNGGGGGGGGLLAEAQLGSMKGIGPFLLNMAFARVPENLPELELLRVLINIQQLSDETKDLMGYHTLKWLKWRLESIPIERFELRRQNQILAVETSKREIENRPQL